jgi:hypothetical protein
MTKQTYPEAPQRTAQDLHDAIVAHNEAMKAAMLLLLRAPFETLPDEVLDAAQKICGAMSDLTEHLKPLVAPEDYDKLVEDHFG